MLAVRTVYGSSARTATTISGLFPIDNQNLIGKLAILWSVSAITGTSPTVDHTLQWTVDNGLTWHADTQFAPAQMTAAGSGTACVDIKGSGYRLSIVIGGTTPSVTSSVQIMTF